MIQKLDSVPRFQPQNAGQVWYVEYLLGLLLQVVDVGEAHEVPAGLLPYAHQVVLEVPQNTVGQPIWRRAQRDRRRIMLWICGR